jgi:hypothetical protein
MPSRNTRKPILVTGSHRSGSTWAAGLLAAAPHTTSVHEHFNLNAAPSFLEPNPFTHWFQYVCEVNSHQYKPLFDRVLLYKCPVLRYIHTAKTARRVKLLIKQKGLSLLHKIRHDTPILKDPIAIFSAEWLCKSFDMNVLVMIRHPAAFCSSLKIKGCNKFDFNNFLNQPLLMKDYLGKFEQKISEYANEE